MKHLHITLTTVILCVTIYCHAQKQQLFRLVNGNGMEAVVSNYGARLVSLTAHNWNGRLEPVIKDCKRPDDCISDKTLGATLVYFGKNKTEILSDRTWEVVSSDNQSVSLRYITKEGENGLNGRLNVNVTYTLSDQNALDIDYRITTTATTPIEVTMVFISIFLVICTVLSLSNTYG